MPRCLGDDIRGLRSLRREIHRGRSLGSFAVDYGAFVAKDVMLEQAGIAVGEACIALNPEVWPIVGGVLILKLAGSKAVDAAFDTDKSGALEARQAIDSVPGRPGAAEQNDDGEGDD